MSLRDVQRQVLEFHEKLGAHVGDKPGFTDNGGVRDALRVALVAEEAEELAEAVCGRDFVEAADALADIIYVCLGAAVSWGIDLGPIFERVHVSNMAKAGGKVREDGKVLKPEGWTPPDVRGELESQGWRSGR